MTWKPLQYKTQEVTTVWLIVNLISLRSWVHQWSYVVSQHFYLPRLIHTVNIVIMITWSFWPTYCEFQSVHHQYSGVTLQRRKNTLDNMTTGSQQSVSRDQIKPEHFLLTKNTASVQTVHWLSFCWTALSLICLDFQGEMHSSKTKK